MNKRDLEFLSISYERYLGRIQGSKIDTKQVSRFLNNSSIKTKNPFLSYSISEKSEQEKRQDYVTFAQLAQRVSASILAKGDQMALDMIIQTLDFDKDGFIGIEDVNQVCEDLGIIFQQDKIQQIMEKISEEGTKISKNQLASLFWM